MKKLLLTEKLSKYIFRPRVNSDYSDRTGCTILVVIPKCVFNKCIEFIFYKYFEGFFLSTIV